MGSGLKGTLKEKNYPPAYRDDFVTVLRESDLPSDLAVEVNRSAGFYEKDVAELSSRSWWKRAQALNRLKYVSPSDIKAELTSLLYDSSHEVRLVALDSLSFLDEFPEIHPIRLLESFTHKLDSFLAIKLFTLKPPENFLKSLVNSDTSRFRRLGAILLGQEKETSFLPLLRKLTEDEVVSVRIRAVESLGKIGEEGTVPILKRTGGDPVPEVREASAEALGRISTESSIQLLANLAEDEDFGVRLAAFHSLARFGEKGRKVIGDHWSQSRNLAREAIFESHQE